MDSFEEDDVIEQEVSEVQQLVQLWNRERNCPSILPYNEQLVQDLTELLNAQIEIVSAQTKDNRSVELLQFEIERVTYLIKAYLLARQKKIQKHARYIVLQEELLMRLSDAEQNFVVKYADMSTRHYKKSLKELPVKYQSIEEADCSPDLEQPVLIKVMEELGTIMLAEGVQLEMKQGDIFFIRYRYIEHLLLQDQVNVL